MFYRILLEKLYILFIYLKEGGKTDKKAINYNWHMNYLKLK